MLGDTPRMMFLHYYGRGPAAQLAIGFRAALDQLGQGKARPMQDIKHQLRPTKSGFHALHNLAHGAPVASPLLPRFGSHAARLASGACIAAPAQAQSE